jgi:hypothetical protein
MPLVPSSEAELTEGNLTMDEKPGRARTRLANCANALNLAAFVILFVFVGIALIR